MVENEGDRVLPRDSAHPVPELGTDIGSIEGEAEVCWG